MRLASINHSLTARLPGRVRIRWGIAAVLTLSMVAVITLLMAVITVLDIRQERDFSRQRLEERGLLLEGALNEVVAHYIQRGELDAFVGVVETVSQQPDVDYIQVLGVDGSVLLDSRSPGDMLSTVPSPFAQEAVEEGETRLRFRGDDLEVASPVSEGGGVVGGVRLSLNSLALKEEIRGLILQHIWQGLILVAIGVALSSLIAMYFARPINRLVRVARKLAEGEFQFPNIGRRSDEIGDLAVAFSEMTHKLGDRTAELRAANGRLVGEVNERKQVGEALRDAKENLELRVDERTAALRSANVELTREIGRREQVEDALRQAEERLRTIINHSPLIMFALDQEGVFTLSEGKALEALGGKAGELVGKSMFEVYHDVPPALDNIARALAGEARSAIVHANGVTFDTRYEPMLDRSGHVIGVVGVHHDITALKRAEDLLIKANIELEEANQTLESRVRQRTQGMEDANSKLMAAQDQLVRAEKLAAIGQMAGGVAHDLRNPLGAIKNAAHFLKRRLASGELDESNARIWQLLHIVEEEADNSNQIISDLLTFARVTTPSLSPVNVNGVIDGHNVQL